MATPAWSWAALAVLCVAAGAIGLVEATADAPTIDEPVYVAAGVASLERHDLRINPQHPPLAKALAALPVLLARPTLPAGRSWARHRERPYARTFLEAAHRRRQLRELTLLSRIVPLLELMASGLLVFLLARRLGDTPGGLLAAALWLLNPLTLGIGHVDGIDLPFAVAMLGATLALVRWLERPGDRRLVVVGLACGAAVLIRDTGPLVLVAAIGVVWWRLGSPRRVLMLGGVALALVWAVYLALDPAYTVGHVDLLPQRYVDGLRVLKADHSRSAPAFLLGKLWYGGRWWFWPASMLVKLPASLLLAFAAGAAALRRATRARRSNLLIAAVPIAGLQLVFTMFSPVDFGLRYLLGVIALLCVGCGALMLRGRRLLPIALAVVTAGFAISSIPYSIAWVAPPFGPSYEAGAASNGDWGQDAWRLQRWARPRHAWIACYTPAGTACSSVAGTHRLHRLTPRATVHGWIAISASLLNLHGWDPWLRRFRPVGDIGGTEVLYRVR